MNRQANSFFKRGPSPSVQFFFYMLLSLSILVSDLRWKTMESVRWALGTIIQPVQTITQTPLRWARDLSGYFTELDRLRSENEDFKHYQQETSLALMRMEYIENENARLRRLLKAKEREHLNGQIARILSTSRDPIANRVTVNKGEQHAVTSGVPVVDDKGLIGQVTRVYPLVSEVTLITDKNQVVPVQVARNGLRTLLYGLGDGTMELRFLSSNADVRPNDKLVTSGIDSIYLPGIPVARVLRVEYDPSYAFAKVVCIPFGGVDNYDEVIILQGREQPQNDASIEEATAEPKTEPTPPIKEANAKAEPTARSGNKTTAQTGKKELSSAGNPK